MAYCSWFAGGGNKSGTVRGATDAIGYRGVGDRHYCSDIHATIVNQMGLDHKKMQFQANGRAFKLIEEGEGSIRRIIA